MRDQNFYGHGKLLLSGEYFVLDGAQALALPTTVGQSMKVKYRHSYQPTLQWKSLDHMGNVWFEANYEFWHFDLIKILKDHGKADLVRDVLRAVRMQNPHFLRDDMDVFVETKLEFPLEWGLGSSSTFIYNVAQWAYVGPFELLNKTIGGSGYDIACAQALGPIKFHLEKSKPQWEKVVFDPQFKSSLYFVYLGKKQNSQKEIRRYNEIHVEGKESIVSEISSLTNELIACQELRTFERILKAHEELVGAGLGYTRAKDLHFSDYWGEVKSLGAWGGDFVLVTSDRDPKTTIEYFHGKGLSSVIPYHEIVMAGQGLS
jgi:mevalonate kinase